MSESLGRQVAVGAGIIGGVALIIGGFYCLAGWASKCQKCEKWFAHVVVNKTLIKEEKSAKDVDRRDVHYDKEGHVTGETSRKERVYGKNMTYDNLVRCKYCRAEHNSVTVEWVDC